MQETHVLGALDGQFVQGVMVDHFRNRFEWFTELAEHVASLWFVDNLHVHEPSSTPAKGQLD